MKRYFFPALVLALLLAACGTPAAETTPTPTPTPEVTVTPTLTPDPTPTPVPQFRFARENFPRLDGSTATVPLGQAVAAVLLSEPVSALLSEAARVQA